MTSKTNIIIRKREMDVSSNTKTNENCQFLAQSPNIDSVLDSLMSIKNDHFDPEKLVRECTNLPRLYRGKYYIENKKGGE
jgi:hypothetical protein